MTRKLNKEHLDAIQNMRTRFAENAGWLGNVSIELKLIERQREQVESRYDELMLQFDQLREEEAQLIETLKERYGDGQIDISSGTFTPSV